MSKRGNWPAIASLTCLILPWSPWSKSSPIGVSCLLRSCLLCYKLTSLKLLNNARPILSYCIFNWINYIPFEVLLISFALIIQWTLSCRSYQQWATATIQLNALHCTTVIALHSPSDVTAAVPKENYRPLRSQVVQVRKGSRLSCCEMAEQ